MSETMKQFLIAAFLALFIGGSTFVAQGIGIKSPPAAITNGIIVFGGLLACFSLLIPLVLLGIDACKTKSKVAKICKWWVCVVIIVLIIITIIGWQFALNMGSQANTQNASDTSDNKTHITATPASPNYKIFIGINIISETSNYR